MWEPDTSQKRSTGKPSYHFLFFPLKSWQNCESRNIAMSFCDVYNFEYFFYISS